MSKIPVSFIGFMITVLLCSSVNTVLGMQSNLSLGHLVSNSQPNVLHVGKNESISALEKYGNQYDNSTAPILIKNSRNAFRLIDKQNPFDISQRVGNVSIITYNLTYKPIFKSIGNDNLRAFYEAPSNIGSRKVYKISGYPIIKTVNSIP